MKIFLLISVSIIVFSCNSTNEQVKDNTSEAFTYNDVVEQHKLIYFKGNNNLFSGMIVEKDSLGRVVKEMNYEKGKKHGPEIQFEYFESDLAIIIFEGNWTNGKKSGIWKSHDGEGQMTIVKDYDKNNK